jgi:hypothetical protein
MPWTRILAAIGVTSALLAAPALAHATTTYCVDKPSCETAGGTHENTLDDALSAAQSSGSRDRIEIGPGTYDNTSPANIPAGVDIVGSGSGPGGTLLTRSDTSTYNFAFKLTTASPSTISSLAVQVPNALAPLGFDTNAQMTDVTVDVASGVTYGTGVNIRPDGSLSHSTVNVPLSATGSTGVGLADGTSVSDSTISGPLGVQLSGSSAATVQRTTIHAYEGLRTEDDELTIDNSLIRTESGGQGTDPGNFGIYATVQGGSIPPFMHATALTLVGPGAAGSVGMLVDGQEGIVRDSIVRGYEKSFVVDSLSAPSPSLLVAYSNYDTSPVDEMSSPPPVTIIESHRVTGDPDFVNPSGGNYRLAPGSPLIDAGDPSGLAAGESSTDLDGNPRIVGAHDVGAYELQPFTAPPSPPATPDKTAPTFSSVSETNRVFAVGKSATPVSAKRIKTGTTFRYTLSEAANVKLVIAQKLPGRRVGKACRKPSRRNRLARRCTRFVNKGTLTRTGSASQNSVRFSGRIGRRALGPGSYRVTITATDGAGNVSKHASLSFGVVKPAKKKPHR